jgi:cellulose synthase/poly-beta-1,6-N-acetylglucosamine synthase-like glycosyltransferase
MASEVDHRGSAVPERRTRTHRRLPATPNASVLLSHGQWCVLVLILAAIAASAYYQPRVTLTVMVAACMVFYIVTALLKLVITLAGRGYRPPRRARVWPEDPTLPAYAVLLPVHKEANMLRHLVSRVDKLVYPRRKLLALLLIEHDDVETLEAARRLGIPGYHGPDHMTADGYLRVVVIPPGGPKTKPNALNVAMNIVVTQGCEFVTVYDAEDRPAPDQLLKAVGTFRATPSDLAGLQSELAFWNDDTNWVTALYWVGYKIHFTRFVPGLARLGLPVPLGGSSNHFRVSALLDAALWPGGEAWDPHNLTEDADLGARLAAVGYRIDLLPSITMEEAPVSAKVVDKQQRRWKAGYIQTGLVHTRRPVRSVRRMGLVRWLCFNLLILGVPISFLLNPLFIALTVLVLITHSPLVAALFPTAVYYPSLAVMLLANLGLLYELVYTCLDEAEHARGRFGLVRYMLLVPLMWLWMSRSTYLAVLELVTGKRAWHKTPHGHAEADNAWFVPPSPARRSVPPGWQASRPPGWLGVGRPDESGRRQPAAFAGHAAEDRTW